MNRNQKIAVGCGAAGCLGLIVLTIICVVAFLAFRPSAGNSNRNRNINTNRSSSENSTATPAEESSSLSMSDDDKHKLFQAGAITQDMGVVQRVWKKLGLIKADGSPNDQYGEFMKEHVAWLFKNGDFIRTIDTPEKGRAYVDAHIND